MVKRFAHAPTPLDDVFASLSDPVRRDILRRVAVEELTVGAVAAPYDISLAAVSKHLKVLERSRLIAKRREGKRQLVRLVPDPLAEAKTFLDFYTSHASERFDALGRFLEQEEKDDHDK